MEYIDLQPITHMAGTVILPGSKSISNRILLLAALAEGVTEVKGLLASDDTGDMLAALASLGVQCEQQGDTRDYVVQGVAGVFPVKQADLFLGNAGTAFRPLTAALALSQGQFELSGVPRMHERPIGDLVEALRQLGADIDYRGQAGFPLNCRRVPLIARVDEGVDVRGIEEVRSSVTRHWARRRRGRARTGRGAPRDP